MLQPADWANAIGSTLEQAVTSNTGGGFLGQNFQNKLAVNLFVGGALSAFDKEAGVDYLINSVGNTTGSEIGNYLGDKFTAYWQDRQRNEAAVPSQAEVEFDPVAGAFDDGVDDGVKSSPLYQTFEKAAEMLPKDLRDTYLRELQVDGVDAVRKLLSDKNLYFANPDIAAANAMDAVMNFAPSEKAAYDRIFEGGVNGSLDFYYQGLNGMPYPHELPLAAAYIALNGDVGGNGYTNFKKALSDIGITSGNAGQSAVYLVQPGMSKSDVLNDIRDRLGSGFSMQLDQSPDVQAYLAERVSGVKAGQLVNITDFWQAAVGDTVRRAYNHEGGGYFRDVIDNKGTVPLFSKILGSYNFKSIVATDDLAPKAYKDYNRRSLGVDVATFLATTFLPVKGIGAALRGEVSLASGRIGFAGLADKVFEIRSLVNSFNGIGPLKNPAKPVLTNEGVLLNAEHGMQSRSSGMFADVKLGAHGDTATKYLFTVDERGINIILEKTPFPTPRGNVVHTNLSSKAAIGGEMWFGPNNTVTINAGSGRFGYGTGITEQQWNATANLWKSLGYERVNLVPLGKR